MLDKLDDKQRELMGVVKDEWLGRFNRLEFDEKKASELVDFIYEISGLEKPKKIVLDSPLALNIAGSILSGSEDGTDAEKYMSEVGEELFRKVESSVMLELKKIGVKAEKGYKISKSHFGYYGDVSDYGWVSSYDFYTRIGVINNERFNRYKELIKAGIFMTVQFDKVCLICRPPVELNRNENGEMHSTSGYAIRFRDGYGQFFVEGASFSGSLFRKAFVEGMTGAEIMTMRNAEQKTRVIKHYGYEKVMGELSPKVIDEYEHTHRHDGKIYPYRLIEIEVSEGVPFRLVEMVDYTSGKKYWHGVPIGTKTVEEGMEFLCKEKDKGKYFSNIVRRT